MFARDLVIVVEAPPSFGHGFSTSFTAQELEVGPENGPQNPKTGELDLIAIQYMNLGTFCGRPHGTHGLDDVPTIVLMIAGHVDDGSVTKGVSSPFNARRPDSDVTGQHDEFGVDLRYHEIGELRM